MVKKSHSIVSTHFLKVYAMIDFIYTARFEKHFNSLTNIQKLQTKKKLGILATNPMHPSLRTKKVQGTNNIFECSVNMDIRILWRYKDHKVNLLDIGHHSILD